MTPITLSHPLQISIHALREERDNPVLFHSGEHKDFNPRAPRGARPFRYRCMTYNPRISIHALREERDTIDYWETVDKDISIHALREERDY